jgi:predicted TIM-barrel fold metal-dependent hydrolase
VQTAGVDHVLFGSDFPPVPIPLERSVAAVRNLAVPEEDKEKILGGNAITLLRLTA